MLLSEWEKLSAGGRRFALGIAFLVIVLYAVAASLAVALDGIMFYTISLCCIAANIVIPASAIL